MENKQSKTSLKKKADADSKKAKSDANDKEIQKLKEQISELEQQKQDVSDKYIRLAAEFDNYRKRTQKEMADIIEYAGEKVLRNVLPVLDDFERALAHHEGEEDTTESLQKGLELIYKKFLKTLTDMDVKPMDAVNQPFDPDLHHALMVKEVEGVDPDIVVEEFEKGYLFKKHVLRHAKVVVSK